MSVPRLRFKEFNEDWNLNPIDQIATVSSGGTPSRTNKEFWNGDIPWVTTSEVKFNIIRDTEQKITEQGLQSSSAKIFPKDTLLIAMYGQGKTRGQIAKLGIAASTNQACAAIILKEAHNPDFFFQYLQNQYESLRSLSNDGGQKNLSASLIKSVSVVFPNLPEQTKIANFLTAVDEKIAQLTQKCNLLAQYKKGVMQQIFSQQLRFKDDDGRDFPEWDDARIGELIFEKSTKYNPENQTENLKCIELEHLSQETGVLLGYIDAVNQKSIKNRFNKGDVLFGKLRPYLKKFLKAPFDGVCSTEIWVLKGKKLANDFLYQLVQTENFLALTNISSGSKMPRADWGIISSAVIQYPTLPEQTKIAIFLTAIDDKINNAQAQLAAVKQYKQGLLQQMFV